MSFAFSPRVREYLIGNGLKEWPWLLFCFLLATPKLLVAAVHQGLDPSWNISLSLALQNGFTFGKDYMFTYGPLGVLAAKNIITWSKWTLLCFEIPMLASVVFIARYYLRKSGYSFAVYVFFPLQLFLMQTGSMIHYMTPFFLFFIFHALEQKNKISLFIAVPITIIGFYIKVNFGLVLILLFYISLLYAYIRNTFSLYTILSAALVHIFGIFILAILLNVYLPGYVVSSLHLINAFNDAMYVLIAWDHIHLLLGGSIIALFALGSIVFYKQFFKNTFSVLVYLFCGFYLYLLFKNGFVRADAHRYEYFQQCAVPFCLTYLWIDHKQKRFWAILTCCIISLSLYTLIDIGKIKSSSISRILPDQYAKDIFTDISYKKQLDSSQFFEDTIPKEYVNEIGTHTVDIMPWEISELYRWKMNYMPRPVVQSYSAYDEYLDKKNYDKYISSSAPKYVIFSGRSIDNRPPFWDESITKRALLTHYQLIDKKGIFNKDSVLFDLLFYLKEYPDVAAAVANGSIKSPYHHYLSSGRNEGRKTNGEIVSYYLLFKKREHPLKMDTVKTETISITMNRDYYIPPSDNLQYLSLDVKYNLLGKLKRFLFQPPPLMVELTYADGGKDLFKAIVPILNTGVLLNRRINNTYDAGMFFHSAGQKNTRVVSVKFMADSGFNPSITGTLRELRINHNE